MDQVIQWFHQNGGKLHPDIEAKTADTYGLHFISTKEIPADQIASFCPFKLSLSYLNCLSQPPQGVRKLDSNASKLIDHVDPNVVAAFALAEERLKGEQSFWAPYINLLPKETELSTPLWFTDEELIWFKGTNLFSSTVPKEQTAIGQRNATYVESWKTAIGVLESNHIDVSIFTW
jgi:hypothetical protein